MSLWAHRAANCTCRESLNGEAEAVHLSQPAFSRRIGKLEQALGVQLLERTTRRVSLTAVGR
jgi:DNA-binding transcriptional LysR family regulator